MFETAQQEPSSGSGKIIAGVVAVVVVLIVAVYFIFLRGQPAATTAGNTTTAAAKAAANGVKADPMRDLTIVNYKLHRDQTQTMAVWNIEVENRSSAYGYKEIKYSTNYYNAQNALLYHNVGTLSDALQPSDQHTYTINDGLYPVGTSRYTIQLTGAVPVQ